MKHIIWATDCPNCENGIITLDKAGGIAKCSICGAKYETDWENHPELDFPTTEYWLTNKIKEDKQ